MVRVKVLLFQFKDGRALTHSLMILELREALESIVLKPEDYAGHSFRIDNHYCMWHPSGSDKNSGLLKNYRYLFQAMPITMHLLCCSSQLARWVG